MGRSHFRETPEKEEIVMTDSWMTWAARPEELGPPLGLVRRDGAFQSDFEAEMKETIVRETTENHASAESVNLNGSGASARARKLKSRNWRLSPRGCSILGAIVLAGGACLAMPACQSGPILAVTGVIGACIEAVKALVDEPNGELPAGFAPCGQISWRVEGNDLKFCLYCDPSKPQELYVQLDCKDKFYPMRLRRIEQLPSPPINAPITELDSRYISIEKFTCDDRFLIDAVTTVAPFMSALDCTLRAPNTRVMPSVADYETLDVRIDGMPATRDGDFEVASGSIIDLTGSFDEVAHYAMTCGILTLSFKEGGHVWTVHANPDVSAIAVFRDSVLYDARFLFAPQRSGQSAG